MRGKYVLPITLFLVFLSPVSAQVVEDVSATVDGDFTQGGIMETTFNYTLGESQRVKPIDTVLVIDGSGSMSGPKIDDAQTAAKTYVDRIIPEEGDRVAVVVYRTNGQEQIAHGLSSDKDSLKNAIDSIDTHGNTCIDCGIELAMDGLNWDSDAVRAMVVLTDGKDNQGGDPGTAAEDARDDGIEALHGVLYGNGADVQAMSDITDAECVRDADEENNDFDDCWFAAGGDELDQVYQAISKEVALLASAVRINVVLPPHADPISPYVSSETRPDGNVSYVVRGPSPVGEHSVEFLWSPTIRGDRVTIMTGESFMQYKVEGENETKHLGGHFQTAEIGYIDYILQSGSISKDQNGVNIDLRVANSGNYPTRSTTLTVYRNDRHDDEAINVSVNPLQPGENRQVQLSGVSRYRDIFTSTDPVHALFDSFGAIPGHGMNREEDESNNQQELGVIDVTPPTTNDDYSGSGGWHLQPVPVQLTCSDNHAGKTTGCSFIHWQVVDDMGVAREGYASGTSKTVRVGEEAEGELTLRYRGFDNNYNNESWNEVQMRVDDIGPDPEIVSPSPDQWFEDTFRVDVDDQEDGAGLNTSTCRYRFKDGHNGTWTGWRTRGCPDGGFDIRVPGDCSLNGEDECVVETYVEDVAGNNGTDIARFNIDTKPPDVDCDTCAPEIVATEEKITVKPNIFDGGTGAVSVTICADRDCQEVICGYDATKTDRCSTTAADRPLLVKEYWIEAQDGLGHTTTKLGGGYSVKAKVNEQCNSDTECITNECSTQGYCTAAELPPVIEFFPEG